MAAKNAPSRANKTWSEVEKQYLREHWGTRGGYKALAMALGRTPLAVKEYGARLGLGPFVDGATRVSLNQLVRILYGRTQNNGAQYAQDMLVRLGLPIIQVRVMENRFRMVEIDAFWRWAEAHQDNLDFSRFEENALGAEPDWVKVKRGIDRSNRGLIHRKKTAWTPWEVECLTAMLHASATYEDLTRALKRTSGSIRRKIYDLYLPKPRRSRQTPWPEDDLVRLARMSAAGCSIGLVARAMGRSPEAVRGKLCALKKEGQFDEYAGRPLPPPDHRKDEPGARADV